VVVLDGKEGEARYDEIRRITFSPDGRRLAFAARRGEGASTTWMVVVDGVEGKGYDAVVDGPVFSPDSRRVGYQVGVGRGAGPQAVSLVVVVDGREWEPSPAPPVFSEPLPPEEFENLFYWQNAPARLRFSPDGRQVAAVLWGRAGYRVVVDGVQQGGEYAQIPVVRFGPGGGRLAFAGRGDRGLSLVTDGGRETVYPAWAIRALQFSADGKRLALAANGNPAGVRVDGVVVGEGRVVGELAFSPGGDRLMFSIQRNGVWVVEVDGREQPDPALPDAPHSLRFSPDGGRVAYAGRRGPGAKSVFVDGAEGGKYLRVAQGSLTFSPGGEWVAYAAYGAEDSPRRGKTRKAPSRWRVVVGDAEAGDYDEVWAARGFAFDGRDSFYLVAVRGREVFRVECRIVRE
jgi:hypothetical protein